MMGSRTRIRPASALTRNVAVSGQHMSAFRRAVILAGHGLPCYRLTFTVNVGMYVCFSIGYQHGLIPIYYETTRASTD